MKEFKFFQKEKIFSNYMDMMDDFFLGDIRTRLFDAAETLQETVNTLQQTPLYGLSYYQWNILPQDVKNMGEVDINVYLEGWENARSNILVNPYHDMHNGELWNRGFMDCMKRRTR